MVRAYADEEAAAVYTLFDAAGANLLTEAELLAALIREGYPASVAECLPALCRAGMRTPRAGVYGRPLPVGYPWITPTPLSLLPVPAPDAVVLS